MKENINKLLAIFVLLNAAKKQFQEFDETLPTDVCDKDYISQYPRVKFKEYLEETKENLWAIVGKLAKFDLDTLLPIAVEYLTDGNVVLEKATEIIPKEEE